MAHLMRASATPRLTRVMASLTATLLLGACAQTSELLPKSNFPLAQNSEDAVKKQDAPQNELQKATAYWGQEYAKKPSELKPALSYARNLKALGEKTKALAVLEQSAALHNNDPELAGEYGRLALELDQVSIADRMLQLADDPSKPDWKVISARGTVLAKQGQYKDAIPYYERALTLAPNQASVLNNLAMAYAMSGNANKAEELLRQASAGNSGANSAKVKQNLALVLGLEGRYDEARSVTAGTDSAAAVADNMDMVRRIVNVEPNTPSAVAEESLPDFKTKASRAIATAESPATSGIGPDAAHPARPHDAPGLKAAAVDPDSAVKTTWEAKVAADASDSVLKGPSQ